jgi:hypothetical protein
MAWGRQWCAPGNQWDARLTAWWMRMSRLFSEGAKLIVVPALAADGVPNLLAKAVEELFFDTVANRTAGSAQRK